MRVLTVQSSVAYGYVGNSAALFPLQRLGLEVCPVNTVQFSNHPGYGGLGGEVLAPAHVADIFAGLDRIGALATLDGAVTGYLGHSESGEAALEAVRKMKAAQPNALYLCDPVMGDDPQGFYVEPSIVEFFHDQAVPAADVITPNRFELEILSGMEVVTAQDAIRAARSVIARGPRTVFVTSVGKGKFVSSLAVTQTDAATVITPRLSTGHPLHGGGDYLSAVLLAYLLLGENPAEALSLAVSSLWGIMSITVELKQRELALVAAQDQILHPSRIFPPIPVE